TVEENHVRTEAELTLQDLRGQTKDWLLWVPRQTVEVKSQDERVLKIEQTDKTKPVYTVRLREASVEPIQVVVKVRQARPFTRLAVGPFTVQGAQDQHGTIVVQVPLGVGRSLWLTYLPNGEVNQ